jgi:uncharacterized protein (TIGR03437 family)
MRLYLAFALLAPIVVAQQTGNWTRQVPQDFPSPRYSIALAYDSAHAQSVLFGGTTNDTWVWDGVNWTLKIPQHSPTARINHAMAYDSIHGQVVLFGGTDAAGNVTNDTWIWDGTDWTQESPETSPPARQYHAMAYDSTHDQVVLFGGEILNTDEIVYNDTWIWNGNNWIQESPKTSPPGRQNSAMAFDSVHGQTVLFGGFGTGSDAENDTWVWDGSNWTQEFPATSPPGLWRHAMAFDSLHGQVVLFGGGLLASSSYSNETWIWDGTNWTQESPETSPPARALHAMAYDSLHDQVVLFGGQGEGLNNTFQDTWTWTEGPLPPAISSVVNGASFVAGGVVPGEIATAFGTNLTSSTGINLTSSLPLPDTFVTDSLMVNNQSVALFAVDNVNGQQQINFQVPWEAANGPTATVAVSNNGTAGASISVPVLTAQPGIFNYSAGGNTFGAILHANFQLANTANPAKPGETVLIYCTGLGAVVSAPADGAAGNGEVTMNTPTVMIGGSKALVSFSGLAPGFVGLYQVNAEVPAGLDAGNQAVVVEIAGASSNSVLLPVQ